MAGGIFAGLKDAKASFSSNYDRPGHYYMLINACKTGESRKKEGFFCIEKTVVFVIDDDGGKGHKVGEDVTHMMMEKFDSFLGNVKATLAGITGEVAEDIGEEDAMLVCGEDQPLAGTVAEVKNNNTVTKANNDFTNVKYLREVPPEEVKEILTEDQQERFFPGGALDKLIQYSMENAEA